MIYTKQIPGKVFFLSKLGKRARNAQNWIKAYLITKTCIIKFLSFSHKYFWYR